MVFFEMLKGKWNNSTAFPKWNISPEFIRNVFIGLNDGLVGTLGAVSGFFAAFHNPTTVFAATLIEATAATFSMAAGSYIAVDSETESRNILQKSSGIHDMRQRKERPMQAALIVGISYILGTVVTACPLAFGAKTAIPSWITAGLTIIVVSYLVASLSGMSIKKRIIVNVCVLAFTAGITYGVGELIQRRYKINF
jgi:VIT1/CCC1 family predicted Fe2+/Mn2+ transporter